MNRSYRPFVATALFCGLMTFAAIAGAAAKGDHAFTRVGGVLACQTAVLLACGFFAMRGAAIGTSVRIAACLPSYAAAALAVGLALERGLSARYAPDLLVLAVILGFQGRAFAAHISTSLHPVPVPALRSRIVVRLRDGVHPPDE